jgi:hypothetical protein
VRRFTSVERVGGDLVVKTEPGELTDVLQHGWLHAEIPLLLHHPRDEQSQDESSIGVEVSDTTLDGTGSGTLTGDLKVTPSYGGSIVYDYAAEARSEATVEPASPFGPCSAVPGRPASSSTKSLQNFVRRPRVPRGETVGRRQLRR